MQDVQPITEVDAAASRPTPRWVRRLATIAVALAVAAGGVTASLGGFDLRRDHIMVAVGEESGAVDDMMEEVGDMYRQEVEYELKTLSHTSRSEPLMVPRYRPPIQRKATLKDIS